MLSSRGVPIAPQVLFFRAIAAIALAAAAALIPEVGPNRFWVAGILLFVCVPLAIWLELRFPVAENGWSEPLFDLTVAVSLVHLVPNAWFVVLVIGVMIVQAPSLGSSRVSFLFHSGFAAFLIMGMAFAAIVHDVPDWELPILAMSLLYPSIIFYSYWQAKAANELRDRAQTLQSLQLLSGGVAHDFNNLLTAVMGHAELALIDLPEGHPARASLQEVLSGAGRASLLSSRLLKFSGREPTGEELLDIESEVRGLAALIKPALAAGVEISVSAEAGPHFARANRAELQQVLLNVILNASEASEREPNPIIVRIAPASARDRSFVDVRVADQGVGIPPAEQDRVFDPFFTSKPGGHGLGLAGARRSVERLGGQIWIASTPGRGTEVRLRIPAQDPPVQALRPEPPIGATASGLALVVDDEASVRAAMVRLLDQLGVDCIVAENGTQAISLFGERTDEISVVVLDLAMPGTNGWECLRVLREIRPDLPAVICSGFDPAASDQQMPPRATYLAKPFRLDGLREALDRIVEDRSTLA
ncbi:MAG: ATP-binding protein [Myxococcota bacterium]|nr:ATP-binding protein [Myxococcota bacterium]